MRAPRRYLDPRMRLYRLWTAVFLMGVVLVGPGCKGECRRLSEKLCECATTPAEKNACLQTAATKESSFGTDASEESVCSKLYKGCDCHTVNTSEGKRACGLAR